MGRSMSDNCKRISRDESPIGARVRLDRSRKDAKS